MYKNDHELYFHNAYINSKELRQAWDKRLQAVLWSDTFRTSLKRIVTVLE
jgi:hypothetical protein